MAFSVVLRLLVSTSICLHAHAFAAVPSASVLVPSQGSCHSTQLHHHLDIASSLPVSDRENVFFHRRRKRRQGLLRRFLPRKKQPNVVRRCARALKDQRDRTLTLLHQTASQSLAFVAHKARRSMAFWNDKRTQSMAYAQETMQRASLSTQLLWAGVVDGSLLQSLVTTLHKSALLVWSEFLAMSPPQKGLLVAAVLLGVLLGRLRPFWIRYTDVGNVPNGFFGSQAPVLMGRAASITDGDTIRFLHQPTPWHPRALEKGQKISEFALPIRICSIDTPETPKFGKPGQPFGLEAKEALRSFLDNQRVYIRLLQKDQYGRGVAQVWKKTWWGGHQHVDAFLLQQGLAEVYRGGGAVYGPLGLEGYTDLEQAAQSKKVGIWSQENRESAAEYKKRTKE